MKRQIICMGCGREPLGNYPGEWHRTIQGYALAPFTCDLCGKSIPQGNLCLAQSMGQNRTPYFEWEGDFIKIRTGTVAVIWQG
jgi:hypothetical protein